MMRITPARVESVRSKVTEPLCRTDMRRYMDLVHEDIRADIEAADTEGMAPLTATERKVVQGGVGKACAAALRRLHAYDA